MSATEEVYTAARYLAVLSAVDYHGESTVSDMNWYNHVEISLRPEAESLENLGILEEEDGSYRPSEEHKECVSELAELVHIEYNGKCQDIEISEDEKQEIEEERTDLIDWIA